jgi:hypothetical protein
VVEPSERFIQQQKRRLQHQRSRDGQSPLLATAEAQGMSWSDLSWRQTYRAERRLDLLLERRLALLVPFVTAPTSSAESKRYFVEGAPANQLTLRMLK